MKRNISLRVSHDGTAVILFDTAGEKVNMLSTQVMIELNDALDRAARDKAVKALVFKSAKPGVFIAGADINEIKDIKTPDEAEEKTRLGQEIMNKIAKLPFPTVSLINGACLGGGLELALACDFRIVSDSPKTLLGAPEVNLGLMPGFGGSVRLPRLVGLAQGLGMILTGRAVDGGRAVKIKLADALYPEAFLEDRTVEFIKKIIRPEKRHEILKKRKKRKFSEIVLEGNPIGRALVFSAAKKDVLKKTRGFYPAPLEALRVIRKNYGKSLKKALFLERKGFAKLALTPEKKNLTDLFFLSEELKKAFQPSETVKKQMDKETISQAAVLGAGKMGGGIAWLFSNSDIPIRMKDIAWNSIAAGYKAVHEIYSELKKIHKLDNREIGLKMHKITGTIDYSGFSTADVVIEAIIEDKEVKIKTLRELESKVREDTVIATNTSSFSVEELSAGLKNKKRFLGFHFFNPVNRMPLIEVVRGPETSELAAAKMIALARRLKKTPLLIKDTNGFLVNRVLMAYLNEAVLMLEEGIDFIKIDKVVYDFGMPMGPFTLLDEIGIKVGYKVAKVLTAAYKDRSEPGKIFSAIGAYADLTGRAAGKGFYLYKNGKKTRNPLIDRLLKENHIHKNNNISSGEILERCLYRMINEAALCLEEGIVEKPEYLDMALMLGTGFPPFRGGLLRYADDIGIEKIEDRMRELNGRIGPRFKPAAILLKMKEKKRGFYK